MDSNSVIWIVIAVVAAIVVIALVAFLARSARNKRRHAQAEEMRQEIGQKSQHVEKRKAIAAETEARARAAQAAGGLSVRCSLTNCCQDTPDNLFRRCVWV